jgi:hypothetical protein
MGDPIGSEGCYPHLIKFLASPPMSPMPPRKSRAKLDFCFVHSVVRAESQVGYFSNIFAVMPIVSVWLCLISAVFPNKKTPLGRF